MTQTKQVAHLPSNLITKIKLRDLIIFQVDSKKKKKKKKKKKNKNLFPRDQNYTLIHDLLQHQIVEKVLISRLSRVAEQRKKGERKEEEKKKKKKKKEKIPNI